MDYQPQQTSQNNTPAIICLVCGIVSIVFAWFGTFFSIVSILAGIAAIIFYVQANKVGGNKSMAVAGLVLGIIGIVFGLIFAICTFIALAALSSYANSLGDLANELEGLVK